MRDDEQKPDMSAMLGRLPVSADLRECRLDEIPEAHDLRKTARLDSGFVLSHMGE